MSISKHTSLLLIYLMAIGMTATVSANFPAFHLYIFMGLLVATIQTVFYPLIMQREMSSTESAEVNSHSSVAKYNAVVYITTILYPILLNFSLFREYTSMYALYTIYALWIIHFGIKWIYQNSNKKIPPQSSAMAEG